jgi:nicotinamidase-related amidase
LIRSIIVMKFNKKDTALVVIDPQNDVLTEKGVSWAWSGTVSRKKSSLLVPVG